MRSQEQRAGFRSAGTALIRAVAHARPDLPPWPDLTDLAPERVASWVDWLRSVWAIDDVAEALEHASPDLAQQVRSLCSAEGPTVRDTRRAALSVARYLQRMVGRATPFGLLAGVASASFGATPRQRWGGHHRAVACAGAQWLADIIAALEGCPDLLSRLPVVVNSTLMVRGNRLIVPYQPKTSKRRVGAVEVSLRFTAAVHAAVEAAGAPITVADLTAKIQAEFPTAASKQITSMLAELVARRVMITSLHAPSTEPDALGHLVEQLRAVDGAAVVPVADLVARLEEIHTLLDQHNQLPVNEGRKDRADVAARMHRLSRAPQHPLAIDLRLDATTVLPYEVAREVERAALVLTRLSAYPVGTPSWRAYHQRFYERYGIGSMVPLLDVVSDSGIGWPDGYPDTVPPERRSPMS
ncbi:MAG TPA: lantibiotic dehydratase family protein, partial [Propionibacteriaceae bacterium]